MCQKHFIVKQDTTCCEIFSTEFKSTFNEITFAFLTFAIEHVKLDLGFGG